MWMSLVVIGIVGVMALVWATRGFFSSLLHLACTLTAGAIAFALWEPLAYWILGSQEPGTLVDIGWGACLVVPFALALTLLSVACSALIRNNIKVGDLPGLIGGGVLGAVAGFITAGIVVLGVGMTRTQSDFFDYTAVDTDNQGSVIRSQSLWVPADRIVASLYSFMSKGALATSDPLAKYYPQLTETGHMFRSGSKGDTLLKYTIRPNDVSLKGRYTVGLKEKTTLSELVGDNKAVLDLDGNKLGGAVNYYLEGIAVQFKAGAKEKGGQIVISPAHVQLVMANSGGSEVFLPVAMISQADGASTTFGRWRFDSKDMLIPSVGSANDPVMMFEFVVPKYGQGDELQPVALYVKGVRLELLDREKDVTLPASHAYASGADRNPQIDAMADEYKGTSDKVVGTGESWTSAGNSLESPVQKTNRLPDRMMLSADNVGNLELNEQKFIMSGEANLDAKTGLLPRGSDKNLIVDRFYPGDGTSIVIVDVTPKKEFALTDAPSADALGAPALMDDIGQKHVCVGYVYRDDKLITITFKPGDPVTEKSKLPSISKFRSDQKLWLVFRVPNGVKLTRYVIGTTPVKEFAQPMPIDGSGQAK